MPCAFSAAAKPSRGAVRQPDGVLRPDRGAAVREPRHGDDIGEPARIAPRDLRSRASISSAKIFSFSISIAAWMVSSRPVMPMRTLSYLSVPCPCTRRLRSISASAASSVKTAPPSPIAAERLGGKEARRGRKAEACRACGPCRSRRSLAPHRRERTGLRPRRRPTSASWSAGRPNRSTGITPSA